MPTITINAFDASKLPSMLLLTSWRQGWVMAVWGNPTTNGAVATYTVQGLTPDAIEEIIMPTIDQYNSTHTGNDTITVTISG